MEKIPVFLAYLPIWNVQPNDSVIVVNKKKANKTRQKVRQKKTAYCRYCNEEFEVVRKNQGYCSYFCQEEMNRKRARERYWKKKGTNREN